MTKTVRIILLTLSLALFVWFIQRTGWSDIRSTFETLGWFRRTDSLYHSVHD